MSSVVFADTSFYVALLIRADSLHHAAVALASDDQLRVITSDFVLIELGNYLASSKERRAFVDLAKRLRSDERTTIISATRNLMNQGIALYSRRADKQWSLTDCTSFVIMGSRGLDAALTGDRHFEQAGYKALLA